MKPIPGRSETCNAMADILNRIGDKWSVMIVGHLTSKTMRFNELRHTIGGISQRMLTLTLRNLERDGLVTRTVFPEIPPRVEYALTELGRTLTEPLERALGLGRRSTSGEVAGARASYDALHDDAAEPHPPERRYAGAGAADGRATRASLAAADLDALGLAAGRRGAGPRRPAQGRPNPRRTGHHHRCPARRGRTGRHRARLYRLAAARTTIRDDPALRDHIPPFDPLRSRAIRDNGAFPELLRTTPGARRSANPGASMAAIGGRGRVVHRRSRARLRLWPAIAARQAGRGQRQGADARRAARHHDAAAPRRAPRRHPRQAHPPLRGADPGRWQDGLAPVRGVRHLQPAVDGLADDYFATIVEEFLATGRGKRGRSATRAVRAGRRRARSCRSRSDWLETRRSGSGRDRSLDQRHDLLLPPEEPVVRRLQHQHAR